MAIDIRATVTCSLGELISGSINDEYIQGNGLVKTKGSCELVGIHTPAPGTVVTFSYARDGVTKQIPRKLRVLSSFADPFRKVTKVELGCKLSYLSDLAPRPTEDNQAPYVTGRQQQCLNGYFDYSANGWVPYPIKASGVMDTCLQKLGLTANRNPLTNVFMIEKFDLTQGYVPALGELLLSESYFGYLDVNEVLQVVALSADCGQGPVLDANSIVDLDAIGVGDLPAESVVVRYDALRLSHNATPNDAKRDWEEEETVGNKETHTLRYKDSGGSILQSSYELVPYSKTVTQYGKDNSWDGLTCVIYSTHSEGADLSDKPIKRTTTERVLKAQAAGNYCQQMMAKGHDPSPATLAVTTKETTYKYNKDGELIETVEKTWDPQFKWAGGIDLDFVYDSSFVSLTSAPVLVEEVTTVYESIYAPRPSVVYLKPGEVYEPVIEAQKVSTTRYQNWALTPQGQQMAASIKDDAPFTDAAALEDWLLTHATTMVMVDSQVQTNRGRAMSAGQSRGGAANRAAGLNSGRSEQTSKLAFIMGSATSERVLTLTMPHQSDDYYSPTGGIVRGDALAKAQLYGRCQNRLLLGNRHGVNIQVHADKMPARPFDPVYLSDGSLMIQYRSNASTWAFSKDGVVASMDALYWGVAGGNGTPWVPVAPGATTFPPLPAVAPDGTATVGGVAPPWGETLSLTGIVRARMIVSEIDGPANLPADDWQIGRYVWYDITET